MLKMFSPGLWIVLLLAAGSTLLIALLPVPVGTGMEIWVSTRIAISVDAGVAALKGDPTGGGEVRLDDRFRYISGGVRVRIGK